MAIKAIGFDLDGTLYPGWTMYALTMDLGIAHPRFLSAFGKVRLEMRRGSFPDEGVHADALSPGERFRAGQSAALARRLDIDPRKADILIQKIIYEKTARRFSLVRPYPGLEPCLAALKQAGFRLGILSDLPCEEKLERMGLSHWFETARCSEDSGALKPDPRSFLDLASRLEANPDEMIYVGNKPLYDVEGARSVGMKTAILSRRDCPRADLRFSRWRDFATWAIALA